MCTASTLMLYMTVFFVWVYSTRSVSGSAVLVLVQTLCGSEVVCASRCGCGPKKRIRREDLDDGAKHNDNNAQDTTTKSWYVVF